MDRETAKTAVLTGDVKGATEGNQECHDNPATAKDCHHTKVKLGRQCFIPIVHQHDEAKDNERNNG